MNWLRWYHGSTADAKWKTIARRANTTLPNVIAVWCCVIESASNKSSERGVVSGWEHEDVGELLGLPPEIVEGIWNAMQGKVLTGQHVTNWEKRQPKREDARPTSTRRTPTYPTVPHNDPPEPHIAPQNPALEERRGDKRRRTTKTTTAAVAGSAPSAPNGEVDVVEEFVTTNLFPAVLGDDWKEITGGVPNYGKLGTQLKAVVQTYGLERVRPAWRKFCGADQRKYGPAYFAEHFGDYETRYLSGYDEAAVMAACGIKA